MRKIRILRVITWLPVGGIERKIVEVLPRLDRERFDVSLVCLRERGVLADDLERRGINVDLIPFARRWDVGALRALARLMRERRIDIVHSHMYRSNLPATVSARLAGVRRVFAQIHNVDTWETRRQLAMDRFLGRWRTGTICVSEQVRREAIEKLRLAPERAHLIYNGVDTKRFGSPTNRAELRRGAGAPESAVVFVMVARMVEQKRPEDFLALAARLLDEESSASSASSAGRPPVHFWFVGKGSELDGLKARARELPQAERIRFFGQRDDIAEIMSAADVFVMPSTKEGFSNALVEAMASGLAPIATDVGGNAEAVRDGQDGLIIPQLEPEALRDAAVRVLDDPDLLRKLQAGARARAETFSLDRMIGNVQRLYLEAMGEAYDA